MTTIEPTDRLPMHSVQWSTNQSYRQALAVVKNLGLPIVVDDDGSAYTSKTQFREALRSAAGMSVTP